MWKAGDEPLVVEAARCSDGGRLSGSTQSRASFVPAVVSRADAGAWPVTITDWSDLQTRMRQRFDGALVPTREAGGGESSGALLLAPAAHGPVSFNATLQEHAWPVADAAGRWLALTVRHGEADEATVARLRRLSAVAAIDLLLVQPRLLGDRIVLVPLSVIARTPSVPDLRRYHLGLDAPGLAASSSLCRFWLELLRKKPQGAPPVQVRFAPASAETVTRRRLAAVADALLAIPETGARPLEESHAATLRRTAHQLEATGLAPVGQLVAAVTDGTVPAPAAVLRAVHVVQTGLALTRPLSWLVPAAGRDIAL